MPDLDNPGHTLETVRMGSLFERHGDYYTNYSVKAFRTMSFEQFKEEVVPRLQDTAAGGDLCHYVLRDLSDGRIMVVQPDCVEEYVIASAADMPVADLVRDLIARNDRAEIKLSTLNVGLPVWKFGEDSSGWSLYVKIPETRISFKSSSFECLNEGVPIYMPPVIFGVSFSSTNIFHSAKVAVLATDSVSDANINLAYLPLPNVSPSFLGRICMGNVRLKDVPDVSKAAKGQLVAAVWDMFVNTNWNTDYLNRNSKYPDNLEDVFNALPEDKKLPGSDGYYCKKHLMLLSCLRVKGNYEKLEWKSLNKEFF